MKSDKVLMMQYEHSFFIWDKTMSVVSEFGATFSH